MDLSLLRGLLEKVQESEITVDEALERLRFLPYEDLGHARLDLHRELRQGMPEVVFCENKTAAQVISILNGLWHHHERVLATRVSEDMARQIEAELPEAQYDPTSRLLKLVRGELPGHAPDAPFGLILSAGTSDLPVAEEAAGTLEFLGSRTERAYDVGVAGLHRLLDRWEQLQSADAIVTVAGMEGALTSVVAGLVSCPVIGLPTSVGYGASFAGLAPLLTMLNACATGVAVVNIDNGFGAGVYAHLILKRLSKGVRS